MKQNTDTKLAATTTRQKDFALGDILSITTERLVSPRKIDGVYDILNFMTGESLFTHQLPRASRVCAPELLRQFPQLAHADASKVRDRATAEAFMAEMVERYGATLSVSPINAGIYESRHPIQEAIDMGAKNIISTDCAPESIRELVKELAK